MFRVLPSSVVYCGFGTRSGKTKDDIKFAALRRKSKDWCVRNQDNVSEWDYIFVRGLLFQWKALYKFN